MGSITNEMVEQSFEIGKKVYQEKITKKEGINRLINIGANSGSADYLVRYYSILKRSKKFERSRNSYTTEYYLRKIFEEDGKNGLKSALSSLSQHINYCEEKGSAVTKKKEIYERYRKLIEDKSYSIIYPDDVDAGIKYVEGKTKTVLVNKYERSKSAREKCIKHYGLRCQVCEINFQEDYGDIGKDFIHVHHVVDVATIGNEYSVDPIKDLIPVCPNCHAMLHKEKPAYTIEELKQIREKHKSQ